MRDVNTSLREGCRTLTGAPTQQTVYRESCDTLAYKLPCGHAEFGVDGRLDTIVHTTAAMDNPWWQLDLGGTFSIDIIHVFNRYDIADEKRRCELRFFGENDCPVQSSEQLLAASPFNKPNQGAIVGLSDRPCAGTTCSGHHISHCGHVVQPEPREHYAVKCHAAKGRYVYVQLPGAGRMLNLREVVVHAMETAPITLADLIEASRSTLAF